MKLILVGAALALCLQAAPALAAKKCEDLKSEIAAALDAKGVKDYTLTIVSPDAVKDAAVVGSCEAGKKKITYVRGK